MADVMTTVSGAINLAKKLLELASVAKDATAKLVLADLQLELAELKTKLADLIEENSSLKTELRKASATVPDVTFKNGMYYKSDDDGPFCTTCYDSKRTLIRLTEMGEPFTHFGKWRCGECKNHFK